MEFSEEEAATVLKSLIVTYKGGIPAEEVDDAFYKFTGSYIPYLCLGYTSLYEYLGKLKGLVKERNEAGILVYKVSTPKTAHIASMVEKQKDSHNGLRYNKPTLPRSKKLLPTGNYTGKRKAINEGRQTRNMQKKRKNEPRNIISDYNQIYDRISSDGEENSGDCPNNVSDYVHWYDEEYRHPVKIMENPPKMDIVCEPIVGNKLLIGDDFFLQLAIRNVGKPIWRKSPNTALHCGLCVSGQTIKECTRSLSQIQALVSKVVIMLGAEDIYRSHTTDQMIDDMEELLELIETRFALSKSAITLCTLPPLANLAMNCHSKQLSTLHCFNSWIREQTEFSFQYEDWQTGVRYNLIEFFHNNTNAQIVTAYDYFQMDARMVSGSSHPYVLWNVRGRRLAMNLLRGGSP